MSLQYVLAGTEEGQNITVFVQGKAPLVAHSTHPNFAKIVEGTLANDESVIDLFDVAQTAASKFRKLTERVSTANGRLFLDNEEVDNALATQVVRFLNDGEEDWKPLVNFFENVQANPNEHSREQLYAWLAKRDFTITPDGLIVGYKSVYGRSDGSFDSVHSGRALVNGEVREGQIKQNKGDVVEMPRSEVQHDPTVGCHTGLHVGTYAYAKNFSGNTILEVHVNPRDVVSVPTDCDEAKVRTCRYTVVDTIDKPYTAAVSYDHYDTDDDPDVPDDTFWGDDEAEEFFADNEQEVEDLEVAPADQAHTSASARDRIVAHRQALAGVNVGDVFETTDPRRAGTQFKVESIEGDTAVGKSLPRNLTRKVAVDRLLSYRYRKVN